VGPSPQCSHAPHAAQAKRHEEIEYSEESIPQATRARLGWLALFLVGLWGAAFVVNSFDEMVQKDVELAYFVPLIIGHGGNAGSQSVSSVIRALATKDISAASVRSGGHVVVKETAVGALCGFALGGAILCVHELMPALISHDVRRLFTPSLFTPSLFTPSLFTPSLFTPSQFTPSLFTLISHDVRHGYSHLMYSHLISHDVRRLRIEHGLTTRGPAEGSPAGAALS